MGTHSRTAAERTGRRGGGPQQPTTASSEATYGGVRFVVKTLKPNGEEVSWWKSDGMTLGATATHTTNQYGFLKTTTFGQIQFLAPNSIDY